MMVFPDLEGATTTSIILLSFLIEVKIGGEAKSKFHKSCLVS